MFLIIIIIIFLLTKEKQKEHFGFFGKIRKWFKRTFPSCRPRRTSDFLDDLRESNRRVREERLEAMRRVGAGVNALDRDTRSENSVVSGGNPVSIITAQNPAPNIVIPEDGSPIYRAVYDSILDAESDAEFELDLSHATTGGGYREYLRRQRERRIQGEALVLARRNVVLTDADLGGQTGTDDSHVVRVLDIPGGQYGATAYTDGSRVSVTTDVDGIGTGDLSTIAECNEESLDLISPDPEELSSNVIPSHDETLTPNQSRFIRMFYESMQYINGFVGWVNNLPEAEIGLANTFDYFLDLLEQRINVLQELDSDTGGNEWIFSIADPINPELIRRVNITQFSNLFPTTRDITPELASQLYLPLLRAIEGETIDVSSRPWIRTALDAESDTIGGTHVPASEALLAQAPSVEGAPAPTSSENPYGQIPVFPDTTESPYAQVIATDGAGSVVSGVDLYGRPRNVFLRDTDPTVIHVNVVFMLNNTTTPNTYQLLPRDFYVYQAELHRLANDFQSYQSYLFIAHPQNYDWLNDLLAVSRDNSAGERRSFFDAQETQITSESLYGRPGNLSINLANPSTEAAGLTVSQQRALSTRIFYRHRNPATASDQVSAIPELRAFTLIVGSDRQNPPINIIQNEIIETSSTASSTPELRITARYAVNQSPTYTVRLGNAELQDSASTSATNFFDFGIGTTPDGRRRRIINQEGSEIRGFGFTPEWQDFLSRSTQPLHIPIVPNLHEAMGGTPPVPSTLEEQAQQQRTLVEAFMRYLPDRIRTTRFLDMLNQGFFASILNIGRVAPSAALLATMMRQSSDAFTNYKEHFDGGHQLPSSLNPQKCCNNFRRFKRCDNNPFQGVCRNINFYRRKYEC